MTSILIASTFMGDIVNPYSHQTFFPPTLNLSLEVHKAKLKALKPGQPSPESPSPVSFGVVRCGPLFSLSNILRPEKTLRRYNVHVRAGSDSELPGHEE